MLGILNTLYNEHYIDIWSVFDSISLLIFDKCDLIRLRNMPAYATQLFSYVNIGGNEDIFTY